MFFVNNRDSFVFRISFFLLLLRYSTHLVPSLVLLFKFGPIFGRFVLFIAAALVSFAGPVGHKNKRKTDKVPKQKRNVSCSFPLFSRQFCFVRRKYTPFSVFSKFWTSFRIGAPRKLLFKKKPKESQFVIYPSLSEQCLGRIWWGCDSTIYWLEVKVSLIYLYVNC